MEIAFEHATEAFLAYQPRLVLEIFCSLLHDADLKRSSKSKTLSTTLIVLLKGLLVMLFTPCKLSRP